MNPHIHPATPAELAAAVAGTLTEIWVEFIEQPPEGTEVTWNTGSNRFVAWKSNSGRGIGSYVYARRLAEYDAPIQPGDTVMLGEEWYLDWCSAWVNQMGIVFRDGERRYGVVDHETAVKGHRIKANEWQPASTMPAELGRSYTAGKSTPEQRDGVWGWVVELEGIK